MKYTELKYFKEKAKAELTTDVAKKLFVTFEKPLQKFIASDSGLVGGKLTTARMTHEFYMDVTTMNKIQLGTLRFIPYHDGAIGVLEHTGISVLKEFRNSVQKEINALFKKHGYINKI